MLRKYNIGARHYYQTSFLYFTRVSVSWEGRTVLSAVFIRLFVQFLSRVWLCARTPWTAARQASLSFTIFRSLLKLMSVESVLPSNHLILCRPLLLPPSIFPSIRVFLMSQLFASSGQSVRASASILPIYIWDWFPSGLSGLISLQFSMCVYIYISVCVLSHFTRVQLFVTLWTVARHAPLSMGFSKKEYWSG